MKRICVQEMFYWNLVYNSGKMLEITDKCVWGTDYRYVCKTFVLVCEI